MRKEDSRSDGNGIRGEIYEKGATAWCLGGAGQQIPAAAELQFTQQE